MLTNHLIEQLNLEITWKCNLDCPMCPSQFFPLNQNRYLNVEQIKQILSKFPHVKMFNIIGCGEPLLHPQWDEIMTIIYDYKFGLTFTTNATLLTKREILKLPLNVYIAISLDSLDPEAYGRIRKNADLNQVIENIKLLRELRPQCGIYFNTLVMRETIDKLHTILPLASKVGATIHLLYPVTFTEEAYHRFYPDKDTLKKKLRKLRRRARILYNVPLIGGDSSPKIKHCDAPFEHMTVGLNGEIFPCCYIYTARGNDKSLDYFNEYYDDHCLRVPQHQYLLGNAFTDDINKVYEGKKMSHIRDTILTSNEPKQDFQTLRRNVDLTWEHEYCKVCALRWGVMC